MKKILFSVLAVVLCFALVACSAPATQESPAATDSPAAAETKEAAGESAEATGNAPASAEAATDSGERPLAKTLETDMSILAGKKVGFAERNTNGAWLIAQLNN
ncbi:MAG: hypothetical protein VB081_07470, partial [Christensenella sp.]|nr:hypothetical protein [Christensenella sp.]